MAKLSSDRMRAVRARHVKSRKGCLTCKVRRIRCDETLPLCHNCQSTGRQCEGPKEDKFIFVEAQRKPSSRRQSPHGSSTSSPGGSPLRIITPVPVIGRPADECRSFDFFVKRTAPLFAAGALNSAFWKTLVPQICHSDPVVWHAVISIATLMEHPIAKTHVVSRAGTVRTTKPQQLQALKWYSRAVSGVKQRMDAGTSVASALLTCILFACIEVQQGNTYNALNLIQHGIKLFADFITIAPKDRPSGYRILDEVVIPFFSQHAIFLATFGLPLLSQAAQAAEVTLSTFLPERNVNFPSPSELRQQLYSLMFLGHELIRGATLIVDNPDEVSRFKPRQVSVLAELQQWRARYDVWMKSSLASGTEWAAAFLLMHYHVTYIWVSICLSPEEITADEHTGRFREAVFYAEQYLLLRATEGADQNFFEFGAEAIPPLYFTVTKCRHPEIRRRALSLIADLPKTDTIWATIPVVAVLENLIAFEERNCISIDTGKQFPAEEHRVHHVQIFKLADSPSLAAKFVTFIKDDEGRRGLKEHLVELEKGKKAPADGKRRAFNSHPCLVEDSTSMSLVMSPEFFGKISPSQILPPTTQPLVEGVV